MSIKELNEQIEAVLVEELEQHGAVIADTESKWVYMEPDMWLAYEYIPELNEDTLRIRKEDNEYVVERTTSGIGTELVEGFEPKRFLNRESLVEGLNNLLEELGVNAEAPTLELLNLLDGIEENLHEEHKSVGEEVAELSRHAIEDIEEILSTLKEFGEGDMDDIKTLNDAIEVLRNMVPELQ